MEFKNKKPNRIEVSHYDIKPRQARKKIKQRDTPRNLEEISRREETRLTQQVHQTWIPS